MAKKNTVPARMKKTTKTKARFLDMSKEELIRLGIIVGAVIIVVVLAFVLYNALDGHLPVENGVVVTEGDNWIITNTGTTNNPRYYKLGVAGDAEGYTFAADPNLASNANQPVYAYTPTEADSPVKQLIAMAGSEKYDVLAERVHANLAASLPNATVGEIDTGDIAGKHARTFAYTYSYDQAASTATEEGVEATPDMVYYSGMYVYLQAGHGRCVVLSASADAQSEDALPDQAVLRAALEAVAAGITIG